MRGLCALVTAAVCCADAKMASEVCTTMDSTPFSAYGAAGGMPCRDNFEFGSRTYSGCVQSGTDPAPWCVVELSTAPVAADADAGGARGPAGPGLVWGYCNMSSCARDGTLAFDDEYPEEVGLVDEEDQGADAGAGASGSALEMEQWIAVGLGTVVAVAALCGVVVVRRRRQSRCAPATAPSLAAALTPAVCSRHRQIPIAEDVIGGRHLKLTDLHGYDIATESTDAGVAFDAGDEWDAVGTRLVSVGSSDDAPAPPMQPHLLRTSRRAAPQEFGAGGSWGAADHNFPSTMRTLRTSGGDPILL